MPTVVFEFDKTSYCINGVRRNGRRRSNSRTARSTRQLRVFVIKTLPMVVVGRSVESKAIGAVRKMRGNTAGPYHAKRGDTHDCGAVRHQAAQASRYAPRRRHAFTPHRSLIIVLPFWLAIDKSLLAKEELIHIHLRFNRSAENRLADLGSHKSGNSYAKLYISRTSKVS